MAVITRHMCMFSGGLVSMKLVLITLVILYHVVCVEGADVHWHSSWGRLGSVCKCNEVTGSCMPFLLVILSTLFF